MQLHLCCPLHARNGSVRSALSLCQSLQDTFEITVWSLPLDSLLIHEQVRLWFSQTGVIVQDESPLSGLPDKANLFLHMGEYSMSFGRDAQAWRPIFKNAASVQFSINFNVGALPKFPWLGDYLSVLYFQNTEIMSLWRRKTETGALKNVPLEVLPPPVDIEPFLSIPAPDNERLVVGLISGAASLSPDIIAFYTTLAERLPEALFQFMPAPEVIRKHFSNHPQFVFYQRDEVPVVDFIASMDIYCFPSDINAQTLQGTRTLVEVMAAGRPSVTVDRLGPSDRIEHGVSGFTSNRSNELLDYVVLLGHDSLLRERMGKAARKRAQNWRLSTWRDVISRYAVR